MPLVGLKVGEGVPLTRMEKKAVEVRVRVHLTQSWSKPKDKRIFPIYFQLSLSNALDRSSLMSIPKNLVILREWIISLYRIMLSRIWHPSTYPDCSLETRFGSRGSSLFVMVLVMIFNITLQRAMGLNLPIRKNPKLPYPSKP